jgi:hypothetical protein
MDRETAIKLLKVLIHEGYGLQMPITNTHVQVTGLNKLRLDQALLDQVLAFAREKRWIDRAIAGHTVVTKIGEAAASQPATDNRAN